MSMSRFIFMASARAGKCVLKVIVDGVVIDIRFMRQLRRIPLTENERRYFEKTVRVKSDDIVRKWIDYFVLHKSFTPEVISRRLK